MTDEQRLIKESGELISRLEAITFELNQIESAKQKSKQITYDNILFDLYGDEGKEGYYFLSAYTGQLTFSQEDLQGNEACFSGNQVKQNIALTKLRNVSIWLNGGKEREFIANRVNYCMAYDPFNQEIVFESLQTLYYGLPTFNSKNDCKQAVAILGEKTIKEALGIFN